MAIKKKSPNEIENEKTLRTFAHPAYRFANDRSGVSIVEYSIIAALLAAVVMFGLRPVGQNTGDTMTSVSETLVSDSGDSAGSGDGGKKDKKKRKKKKKKKKKNR